MSRIPLDHLLKIGAEALTTTAQTLSGAVNELKTALGGKQDTLTFDNAPTQNSNNPAKSGGIYTAIEAAKVTKVSDLTGDVDIDDPQDGQIQMYNGISEKWENKNLPQSGHTMIPVANDIATLKALANGSDNEVLNAYTAKRWANVDCMVLYTTVAKDADTVGTWVDGDAWKEAGASRVGWLWDSALHGIIDDDDLEFKLVFDVGGSEVASVYAVRIDDDVQHGGVDGGAIAFKLNAPIQNASGVKIGIKLIRQRTQVSNLTVLS